MAKKQKHKVLVVDDEKDNLELLERTFRVDYDVYTAASAKEALKIIEENPDIALIITDQRMPGMTGVELLRETLKENPDIVRMLLTGYADIDALIDAVNVGHIYRYISKPWEPRELRIMTKAALEKFEQLMESRRLTEKMKTFFIDAIKSIAKQEPEEAVFRLLCEICPFDAGLIVLRNGDVNTPMLFTVESAGEGLIEKLKEETARRAKELGIEADYRNLRQVKLDSKAETSPNSLNTFWGWPLKIGDDCFGYLTLGSGEEDAWTEDDKATLALFLNEVAIILDNAMLTRSLNQSHKELEDSVRQLRSMQAQLVHSGRMASLGRLVAGVAHELNNPINFVYGNIGFLEEYIQNMKVILNAYGQADLLSPQELERVDEMKKEMRFDEILQDVDRILKSCRHGAERTKEIVTNLRTFSRLDEAEVKEVDIHEGVESSLNLLTNRYKKGITVHKDYGDLPLVYCYSGQLNQVFMNLLANAGQAIPDTGDVWITTRQVDDKVQIMVRDNGVGIPKEDLSKIFDPFYTTKDVGGGMGLGLSITYGIIERHGGTIEVESEVGKGTTFTVTIPVRVQEPQAENVQK